MDISTGLSVIANHKSPHLCQRPEMVEDSSTERGALCVSNPPIQYPGVPLILRLHLMRPVRHRTSLIMSSTRRRVVRPSRMNGFNIKVQPTGILRTTGLPSPPRGDRSRHTEIGGPICDDARTITKRPGVEHVRRDDRMESMNRLTVHTRDTANHIK